MQFLLTGLFRNLEGSLRFLMRPGRVMHLFSIGSLQRIVVAFTLQLTLFCSVLSMFPKSTHETFSEKLYQTFKTHKRFIKPKLARTNFAIAHYAGEVIWILFIIKYTIFCFSLCEHSHYIFSPSRFNTNPISFWIRTKITLFLNTKIY